METTVTRWYTARGAVKRAVGLAGADLDSLIDAYIKGASQHIENILGRRFIPETGINYFPWPTKASAGGYILYLEDLDLIAVTLLQAKAQDTTPTEIVPADYFLEPVNEGPPYNRIEIDLSSSAVFESGDTPQRSIAATGRWGYCEDTEVAGALAGAVATDAVTLCAAHPDRRARRERHDSGSPR